MAEHERYISPGHPTYPPMARKRSIARSRAMRRGGSASGTGTRASAEGGGVGGTGGGAEAPSMAGGAASSFGVSFECRRVARAA